METFGWHVVVDVASILGSLSLVVSVLLLFREVRETNRLTRASNTQSLVSLSSPFYLGLIQDRDMARFYVEGTQSMAKLDDIDKYRYKHLIIWWLIFHENIFYQWRQRLLDDHSFKPWCKELESFVSRHTLGTDWPAMRELFQEDFARHIDHLIDERQQPESTVKAC